MKNCTITFKFGDYEHRITVPEEEIYGQEGERSLPADVFQQRLAAIIAKHKNQWNSIKSDIMQNLKDNSAVSYAVTYSKISGKEGLVPNVNAKYIQDTYPEIEFPDTNVPILLLDNLDLNSKFPVSGRVLDKSGREIFVVRGDKDSLVQLASYLKIRDKVLNGEWLKGLEEDIAKDLQEIADKEKMSPEELMLSFLNDKSKIRSSKTVVNGRSAYVILNLVGNIIKDVPSKKQYKNPILNEFNQRLKGRANGDLTLDLSEFAKQLQAHYPHIFTAQKVLKELFSKKAGQVIEHISAITGLNDEEKEFLAALTRERDAYLARHADDNSDQWGMTTLFNVINSFLDPNENPLSLRPVSVNSKNLILEKEFPTLQSLYGFSYDTVASFTREETRNGYHIYSQTKEVGDKTQTYYFVTPYFINEKLQAIRFANLNEAQEWIDNHYLTRNLRKDGFIDLKESFIGNEIKERGGRTFASPRFIPEGTIFSILDMPLDVRATSMFDEEYLLLDKTLKDFYDYIDTWSDITTATKEAIKQKINTAEKAVIFLSEINRELNVTEEGQTTYPRTNEKKINEILTNIDTKKPSYYYVSKSFKVDEERYRIHFIRTDETAVTTKRAQKRTPVIQLLNSIATEMKEKFGVPVNIVGEEELTEMGIEDLNLVRAFVRNGEIYINRAIAKGSDAFHEYAHLFLGAMKADPELRESYVELIDKVLSTERGQKALTKKMKNFPNVSRMDLAEEVVADLYGEFMEDNLPYELSSLFATNDKIKAMVDTIFDRKDRGKSIRDFDGSLDGIWKRFNSNVAKHVSDNINFLKDKNIQVQRQKANWISEQIGKDIIEKCD